MRTMSAPVAIRLGTATTGAASIGRGGRLRERLAVAVSWVAVACSGADEAASDGGSEGDTSSGPMTTSPSTMTVPVDTSAGDEDTSTEVGCGNGVVELDEQCDDGAANSDTVPDACRTDCRVAHCADGVIDPGAGEECDDGSGNSAEPNACRDTCLLPTCGDGTQDQGEACDDGNALWGDTCQACSNLHYFVLNSPDQRGGGDPSIVRLTRDGAPVQIVGGDPSLAGMLQLALAPGGTTLLALQASAEGGRVHAFDPDGGELWQVAIDEASVGFAPQVAGIAVASDGVARIVASGGGNTRLIALDLATRSLAAGATLGGDLGVRDVVADDAGALYVSTQAGTVVRIDVATDAGSTFGDGGDGLDVPIGLAYDPVQQLVWVANNPAGAPSSMVRATLDGTFTPYSTAGVDVAPYVRGVAIDTGGVVLNTQRGNDRVVAVQNFDAVQDVFTEMITAPTDIVVLFMAP
jgi:cysteine-rich repeat protein